MVRLASIEKMLSKSANTKVDFYFSANTEGEDFDPYEKNYTKTFQNPISKKLYVTEFTPEALAWREQGLSATQGKMVVCDSKYENWFRYATKIVIDGAVYSSMPQGGGKINITKRSNNVIRVILFRI